MAEKDRRYEADVRVVLVLKASGVWGDDCKTSQIEDQAARETEGLVRGVLEGTMKPRLVRIRSCKTEGVYIVREGQR